MGRRLLSLSATFFLLASLAQGYDYVIVGGGTGGLTVAGRLSEDASVSVAVIEAGPNAEGLPEVFIPGLAGTGPASLNWRYPTVPQTNLNGRSLTVNAGKALGGSTVINSMIFTRAEKEQYDVWGKLNNDHAWTWDGLFPFFQKSENFTPPNVHQIDNGDIRFDPSVHGFRGNVKVGYPNFFFVQSSLWLRAAAALGFSLSPDLANGSPHAVGAPAISLDAANNTRCSAACAYFTPVANRPNLTVFLNSTASRIIWKGDQPVGRKLVASAVEFVTDGKTFTVPVEREVVLASGTIGTPKVLELSGVGNSTILSAAGVKTVLDLPSVGENLADHVHSWANSFANISTLDQLITDATFIAEQRELWFTNRTGILSSALPSVLGLAAPSDIFNLSQIKTLVSQARKTLPQFAAQFSNGNPKLAKGIQKQHELALNLYEQNRNLPLELNILPIYSGPTAIGDRPNKNYTSISSVLYTPLSRGRSHITSPDPSINPAVDPNYWAHPIDVAAQVEGIRLARRMLKTPPLASIWKGEFEPGEQFQTDEAIEGWLRGAVNSDNHEVGTASMMSQDLGGVVDTSLTVYGTQNVRVADASIIPFPISAHISSTVYAIGEKAADIIKNST